MDLRTPNVTQTAIHVPQGEGDGQFTNPVGVAVDSYCNVYVAEVGHRRIQKFG